MILVICEPEDTCGLWLVTEIAKRGWPVEHILPDEFMIGSRLSLRVSNRHSSVELGLADGRSFSESAIRGVINRMTGFPRPAFHETADQDMIYAGEEMRAATVAWLAGLSCPVLNLPTPYSASGMLMHESRWRQWAGRYGIRTAALKVDADNLMSQPSDCSVVVIGETVFSADQQPAPATIYESSILLAQTMGVRLLGLYFHINMSGEWEFLRANEMPDLLSIGSKSIDALLVEMSKQ